MNSLATPVSSRSTAAVSMAAPEALHASARLAALLELGKPRIAVMVLISSTVGYLLGGAGVWNWTLWAHASWGVLLAVASASALNQYLERDTDRRMRRTARRPLPTGRLLTREVLVAGCGTGVLSVVWLWLMVNPLTACLAAATIIAYAGVYTPLKRWTPLCTAIGAAPGAMPPVLGWTAAGAPLDRGALALFAIFFVWQFPHFLAIAWMYRDQYAEAGLKMLPGRGRAGLTGGLAVAYSLVMIPVSLLPMQAGLVGQPYALLAVLLGLSYAIAAVRFWKVESHLRARQLLWVSLVYLPSLLLALALDHVRLLS